MSLTLYTRLNVIGIPKPQPRVKACRRGNHAGVYTPATAKGWKDLVMIEAAPYAGKQIEGPLSIRFSFTMPRPKARRKERFVTTKPDLDNLVKSTMDALTDRAVWRDDSQVAEILARKVYAVGEQSPGAIIEIYRNEEEKHG